MQHHVQPAGLWPLYVIQFALWYRPHISEICLMSFQYGGLPGSSFSSSNCVKPMENKAFIYDGVWIDLKFSCAASYNNLVYPRHSTDLLRHNLRKFSFDNLFYLSSHQQGQLCCYSHLLSLDLSMSSLNFGQLWLTGCSSRTDDEVRLPQQIARIRILISTSYFYLGPHNWKGELSSWTHWKQITVLASQFQHIEHNVMVMINKNNRKILHDILLSIT